MKLFYSYLSQKEEDTVSLAHYFAKRAKVGDVFAFYATLGMGKSVFCRAFVQTFLPQIEVPSPTFTLLQTYDAPDFEIYHYDLYRLNNPDEIFELGMEEAIYQSVCLIEWPEKMGGYIPKKSIRVEITPQKEGRLFQFYANEEEIIKRYSQEGGEL